MAEPIDLPLLEQAVKAQSRLIAELMTMLHTNDLKMSADEGHEMLLRSVQNLSPELLTTHLDPIRREFPKHSSED